MARESFDFEHATNGLVAALIIAALALLIYMLFQVVWDTDRRLEEQREAEQSETTHVVRTKAVAAAQTQARGDGAPLRACRIRPIYFETLSAETL